MDGALGLGLGLWSELVRETDTKRQRDQVTRTENRDVFSRRGKGTAGPGTLLRHCPEMDNL